MYHYFKNVPNFLKLDEMYFTVRDAKYYLLVCVDLKRISISLSEDVSEISQLRQIGESRRGVDQRCDSFSEFFWALPEILH